jgi:TonB-dependent SusC/RagA subfamily outer membrane receptor
VNATVSIAGTAYQVSTGEDGAYVIANAPAGVFDVEVRRIGFALGRRDNVRLTAGQATTIDFALSSAPLRLQEVLVSASTESEQKVKMAYSAAKITAADLPVPPNFSAAGAIQGKVAGAQVGRARGPGAGTFVQLRTPTSQFNANSPLYIVDGVILSSQISGTTLDVDNLDIASIEVIQGAVGATLYGARGANGVIQITTNRGRNIPLGATRFSVRSEYGRNELQRDLPRQRAHNFRVNAQGQYVNAQGQVVPRTQRVVDPVGIMDKAYVDPLFSSTATMLPGGNFLTNNVTLEGNSASTNFTANYSQYSEQGIIRDNGGFRRQNVRVNLDHRVRDVLQLSSSASYARQRDQGWLISFRDLYRINPDVDITARNADGSVLVVPDSTQIQRVNPFYRQIFTDSYTNGGRVMLSSQARYTPRSWLSLDANASFDRADRTPITFEPAGVRTATPSTSRHSASSDRGRTPTRRSTCSSARRRPGSSAG